MKLSLTSKVRLYPTNEQAQEFMNIANLYRDVCNVVSQWVFDHHFEVGRNDFKTSITIVNNILEAKNFRIRFWSFLFCFLL